MEYLGSTIGDYGLILVIISVLVFGIVLVVFITRRGAKTKLDQGFFQGEWLKIMNSYSSKDPSSFAMAVINGDKLVDKAMIELGLPGKTMGERLKSSPKKFSNINGLWSAHKLRNRLVHETNFTLNQKATCESLANFKRALKDLGAI